MRRWSGFPGDNSDPSIRQWLAGVLMEAGGSMLGDPRECAAMADRIMAGVDDRSRTVLDVLERRYDEAELNRIGHWLDQVLAGIPVQHALGWTDFRGLRIACGPEALIPRPETEEVVMNFLDQHSNFKLDPFEHPLTGEQTDGQLQIWPWNGPGDAMFIARFRRAED